MSNHTSNDYGMLSFKKGNIIKIFNKKNIEPGYMWGVLDGKQGFFPASFVEDYDVS